MKSEKSEAPGNGPERQESGTPASTPGDRQWAEDWSNPEHHPRMSPALPLIWMLIPLLGCVLYGWLS